MSRLTDIPEVRGLDSRQSLIRIPDQEDVPLTPRIRRLIDSPPFRRLSHISQLGFVSLVYPAATHTRFEHSLGVYRTALHYLRQLADDERFSVAVAPHDAELFIVAALLHDVGHWPYCHPIEDMGLPDVPAHERLAGDFLGDGDFSDAIREDWDAAPSDILAILTGQPSDRRLGILKSLLSGPIDADKMDYLARDSLHAGVPYGRNFDRPRLIGSLCLNEAADGLAIRDKGKTAAEMMVFARYVMFSEVYWHHAVRSATAMFQRAFYRLRSELDLHSLFRLTEHELIERMRSAGRTDPAGELLDGLFGTRRCLYKRLAQFSLYENPELYARLARRPYTQLVAFGDSLAERLERETGRSVPRHHVLFDAPPVKLEVQFNIDVYYAKEDVYRRLGDVSPVVQTLAQRQFDDYVKRVRIFVHPELAAATRSIQDIERLVADAIVQVDAGGV